MTAVSRSLATALGRARFASGLLPACYTTSWDTTYGGAGVDISWREKGLRSVATIIRGAPAGGSTRSEQRTWTVHIKGFEQDLRALPKDVWRPDNLVGVVAITQNQILGLIRFLRTLPHDRLPCVVCQLMFQPSYLPWGAVSTYGENFYRTAFNLAAPLIGRFLFFTVENETMRTLYCKDFGVQTRILPDPFDASGPQRPMEGRVRLGFFGDSRCEKGFHLLPGAIELCRRDGLDAEFIVQIAHNGWEQRTIEAERALRALKGVRFLEAVLSSVDFAAWTGRTDVMLLPYDPVTLGIRNSGIFLECLPPDVPSSHQEEPSRAAALRTMKPKARSSHRTPARRLRPPSPGSCLVFRLARRARRRAPRISPATIAPTPMSMGFWRTQRLGRFRCLLPNPI